MIIENSLRTSKTRVYFLILMVLTMCSFFWGFYGEKYYKPVEKDGKEVVEVRYRRTMEQNVAIALGCIGILTYAFLFMKKSNSIYYNDEDKKIIIRFYLMHPGFRRYKTIELAKNTIAKVETTKSFFNQREDLILFQRTPRGVAKYPPISISGLSKNERNNLIKSLRSYSR